MLENILINRWTFVTYHFIELVFIGLDSTYICNFNFGSKASNIRVLNKHTLLCSQAENMTSFAVDFFQTHYFIGKGAYLIETSFSTFFLTILHTLEMDSF